MAVAWKKQVLRTLKRDEAGRNRLIAGKASALFCAVIMRSPLANV